REVADEHDAPLVFDEITSGFRETYGGYHQRFDINPDVVVYGKALGNGYPISAVVGREPIMDMAQESFVSSTFWTERVGFSAALATLDKFESKSVHQHLQWVGDTVTDGWERRANNAGLDIHTKGLKPLAHFSFEHSESQAAMTLFTQEMLDRGFLAGSSVYASLAHNEEQIEAYLDAVTDVFEVVATALDDETVSERLRGPVVHTKFERLN
ncbi:MAG: aminotransferase class III-fold pyridoxal phosphate-dependent enzyme, partial [Halobacteriaceae archaeon]